GRGAGIHGGEGSHHQGDRMKDAISENQKLSQQMMQKAQGLIDAPFWFAAAEQVAGMERELDCAIAMLAEWCMRIDEFGTGWDDWDEAYKDAMYRPCVIRERLDTAIARAR